MATIYRFVIESKSGNGGTMSNGNGRKSTTSIRGAGKKGKMVSIFGGEKGGVEHNRYTRAINPLMNKATNGVWEKGMRVGRAGMGLVQRNTETGKFGISGTAMTILIAFIIQLTLKIQNIQQQRTKKLNTQNFKQLENGVSAIHRAYSVSVNMWDGRYTYNENK